MWEVMSYGERPYWDMSNQEVRILTSVRPASHPLLLQSSVVKQLTVMNFTMYVTRGSYWTIIRVHKSIYALILEYLTDKYKSFIMYF